MLSRTLGSVLGNILTVKGVIKTRKAVLTARTGSNRDHFGQNFYFEITNYFNYLV